LLLTADERGTSVNQETKNFPIIQIDLDDRNVSRFDQTIIEAVDFTFSKLGVKVKEVFYTALANEYKLSKENIPVMIEEFALALEKIFGSSALLLEIDVIKSVRKMIPEFKFETESSDLTFVGYIKSLKSFMESS
jgi:hypothetical protein